MRRLERRRRTALDEVYRYYKDIDENRRPLELYQLLKCLNTVNLALAFSDNGEFKLTRQLWRRLHQALFDKLITSFAGHVVIYDSGWQEVKSGSAFPEEGIIEFCPDECRRADDVIQFDIARLYPKTAYAISKFWVNGRNHSSPVDYNAGDCDGELCFMKPIVVGQEVLKEESLKGRDQAYQKYWELYWQAYCCKNRKEVHELQQQMSQLENVWGSLFY